MELRSGRTLRSEPPLGARGRRRARILPDCDPDGADHISGLPDDLLHQILVRLRCARAAAQTSLLARRWRGLWRYLPELTFRDIAPGALDTALAQVARAELCLLDIDVPERHRPVELLQIYCNYVLVTCSEHCQAGRCCISSCEDGWIGKSLQNLCMRLEAEGHAEADYGGVDIERWNAQW